MFNFSRLAVRIVAVLLPACLLPVPAAAQAPSGESQSLRLTLSTFGGYDTNVSTQGFTTEDAPSATHGGARGVLRYQIRNDKVAFGATGSADSRYYATDDPFTAASYSGSALFASDLTSRINVSASVNALYSPRFVFSVLPAANDVDLDIEPLLDYGVAAQRMTSYAAGTTARFQISRRAFLSAAASKGSDRLLDEDWNIETHSYGGGFSYNATRYATVRAGYRELVSAYPSFLGNANTRYTYRTYDVGVNYSRPLSVSRRTTLSFGTGSAAYDNERETYYSVTGSASLTHQLGRSWDTSVAYMRGLSVVNGFSEPFFADSVRGNIRGDLTRALAMIISAGYSNGAVGLGSLGNNFKTMQATGRLEWVARAERIGVYGNYFYHNYEFDQTPLSVSSIPEKVDRHGVSAGLIFRLPLLRERTRRVTR